MSDNDILSPSFTPFAHAQEAVLLPAVIAEHSGRFLLVVDDRVEAEGHSFNELKELLEKTITSMEREEARTPHWLLRRKLAQYRNAIAASITLDTTNPLTYN